MPNDETKAAARPRIFGGDREDVEVVGLRRHLRGDAYHYFLRASWSATLGFIVVGFLALNVLFAIGYYFGGGIAHARERSIADAFFFSVQTMATIGYGAMYPASGFANVLVVLEAIVGLIVTAVATGLLFAKFSVPNARVVFTREVTVAMLDGVNTLSFRVGNERGNHVVEAQIRLALVRQEKTVEGIPLIRMHDLHLVRDRSPAFTRTWTVLHRVTPESPLYGATAESLAASRTQLVATLIGVDENSSQSIHARHSYLDDEILFDRRHADVVTRLPDGRIRIDFARFHDLA